MPTALSKEEDVYLNISLFPYQSLCHPNPQSLLNHLFERISSGTSDRIPFFHANFGDANDDLLYLLILSSRYWLLNFREMSQQTPTNKIDIVRILSRGQACTDRKHSHLERS